MMHVMFIVLLGIPFFYIWNALAPIYFYQLPQVYQHFPFWHALGLFALIGIFRAIFLTTTHHHFGRRRWKQHHHCS